jgi:hypothetical protein
LKWTAKVRNEGKAVLLMCGESALTGKNDENHLLRNIKIYICCINANRFFINAFFIMKHFSLKLPPPGHLSQQFLSWFGV